MTSMNAGLILLCIGAYGLIMAFRDESDASYVRVPAFAIATIIGIFAIVSDIPGALP